MSPTPENTAPPMFSVEQLRTALEALEAREPHPDDAEPDNEMAYLLGVLLALVETSFYRNLDRADLMAANDGYLAMLAGLSENERAARRAWALLLQDRLNRTALTLMEVIEERGQMFVDVAGPSMLVAANLLNVVNQRDMAPDMVVKAFNTADRNLQDAHDKLGELRAMFRERAFPDL